MMERKRILIITGALILLAVLLIAGYFLLNKEEKFQQTVIKTPKKQPVQINQPDIVFPTYNYDAQQLRDPFAPLIVKREVRKKGASPLETYEVEELKLTGIAQDKKGALALLQAPDGRFYIVRENDRIGYSGGKVIKILKDSIEIRENKKVKYLKLRSEEEK